MLHSTITPILILVLSTQACAGRYTSSIQDFEQLIVLSNTDPEVNSFENSNGKQYILLENTYASLDAVNTTNHAWSDTLGDFTLFTSNTPPSGNYQLVALNLQTNRMAIITNTLIIKLHNINDLESVMSRYNLEFISNIERLSLVFAKSNNPLLDKETLEQDPRVIRTNIELIEKLRTTHNVQIKK